MDLADCLPCHSVPLIFCSREKDEIVCNSPWLRAGRAGFHCSCRFLTCHTYPLETIFGHRKSTRFVSADSSWPRLETGNDCWLDDACFGPSCKFRWILNAYCVPRPEVKGLPGISGMCKLSKRTLRILKVVCQQCKNTQSY